MVQHCIIMMHLMTWGRLAVSSQNILIYFSSDYNVRQTIQSVYYFINFYTALLVLLKCFRQTEKILVSQSLVCTTHHPSNLTFKHRIYLLVYEVATAITALSMREFLTAAGQSKTLSQWETCSLCFNITVIFLTNFAFYCQPRTATYRLKPVPWPNH